MPKWRLDLERWFIQCQLSESQREVVEEMLDARDRRIAELVREVNELIEQ